jgi:hypothetical protein
MDIPQDQVRNVYTGDLKKLNTKFLNNPTFDNAHDLQSELATELRGLDKLKFRQGTLNAGDRQMYNSFDFAREALKNDMKGFLQKTNPDLIDQYNNAAEHYATNVVPQRNAAIVLRNLGKNPNPNRAITALENANYKQNLLMPKETDDFVDSLRSAIQKRSMVKKTLGGLSIGALGWGLHDILGGQ